MKMAFLGGAYVGRSPNVAANRLVNMYPEKVPEGGKEPAALVNCPGLAYLYFLGVNTNIRSMFAASDGALYVVAGSTVYRIAKAFVSASVIGTISTGSGYVSIADNGGQLSFVDGVAGYTYNFATTVFAQIVDPDFPNGCKRIAYQDTYGVVISPGTQRFFISGPGDFTTWNPLDFSSAEGDPDKAISLLVDHRELWIFGEDSTEVFYNSGNADFPFERIQGGYMEVGCAAVNSVAKLDNSVFWLGKNKNGGAIVWRAVGYQPQRVSTHAIEFAIEQYGDVSTAYAVTYQQEGHAFYMLMFPSAGKTLVFDAATSLWHERAGFVNGQFAQYPISCHAYYGGKNLVGHISNGRVYSFDLANHAYDDQPRKCLRSWRMAHNETKNITCSELIVDGESGVGLPSGQGSDPQMMLRISKNGGLTFHVERISSFGKIGEFGRRAIWRRLGRGRDFVFEISVTDPVKVSLTGAYAKVKAA